MSTVFSNSGGRTTYAQNYDVTSPNSFAPTLGDQWMAGLQADTDRKNASMPRGGGGGGGGVFDTSTLHLARDQFDFQKQQWALENQQKQLHWNAVMGMLGGMANANPFQIGGSSGTGPGISVGGVYNPQQIEQQVNAARAGNDQSAATQQRNFANEAAGRGFASGSPLIAAMNQQIAGANMATNADAERNIRQTAAGQNAEQTLKSQQAAESQYASRQQEQIQRQQPYWQRQNALIAALAGLA